MSLPLNAEQLGNLQTFVQVCIKNPETLRKPQFAFIKTLIEHFGGTIPEGEDEEPPSEDPHDASETTESKQETKQQSEPESEESDLELDMDGVIEPDTDAPQKMGNLTLQPTEEEQAESQAKRSEAVSAFVEKNYDKAIQLYTEAIVLNPQVSLLYAKRGQVYLLLNKPNACIRDCDRALELNPDSAAAHKFRGRARHLLGEWEEAAKDLRLACKFDFDEQADNWLHQVTPNARKIEEHKRKKERKLQEKLEREKQEKLRKARENAKTFEENTRPSQTDSNPGAKIGDFYQFINDLDVIEAFRDPEVAKAFQEMSANPTNIMKYQNNPKIMAFIDKMASKFGAAWGTQGEGMMGGIPGMPGFPGTGAANSNVPKPNPQDDVGLD